MPATDAPGWRPDPDEPEMLRWWNGLGWSDARKSATEAAASVRPVAEGAVRRADTAFEAARQSTVTPASIARGANRPNGAPAGGPVPLATAAKAVGAVNPVAVAGLVLAIIGLVLGAYGVISLVGLVLSLAGLSRSRRLARSGERRTGFAQSLGGLLLSGLSLLRWVPVWVDLVTSVLNS